MATSRVGMTTTRCTEIAGQGMTLNLLTLILSSTTHCTIIPGTCFILHILSPLFVDLLPPHLSLLSKSTKMRFTSVVAVLSLALPILAMPSPEPLLPPNMSRRTFNLWEKWTGADCCSDKSKVEECKLVQKDCTSTCECTPYEGCGQSCKWACDNEGGTLGRFLLRPLLIVCLFTIANIQQTRTVVVSNQVDITKILTAHTTDVVPLSLVELVSRHV